MTENKSENIMTWKELEYHRWFKKATMCDCKTKDGVCRLTDKECVYQDCPFVYWD